MSETTEETGGTGPSHRSVEIGVALFMALLAAIGIYGSLQVGVGWGSDGPRAGFFPSGRAPFLRWSRWGMW